MRLAFRLLFKTPFLTIVAILSLALGIGANTAIFSLFHQLLVRPLPVAEPSALVNLSAPGPKPGSTSCGQAGNCDAVFSYPMFRDLERAQDVFTGVAAHVLFGANFAYDGETINGQGLLVSGGYLPYWQDRFAGNATFYVRTSVDPTSLIPAVRGAIGHINRNLPVVRIRPMPVHVRENVAEDRLVSVLSAAFASVGLYGVLSYTVAQRTREFGLRMALGAAPGRVRRQVLRQVLWMVGIGAATGLALAFGAGQFLASLLFQTQAYDGWIVSAAVAAMCAIALGAGMMPAVRASRIDPMKALRYE